MSSNSRYVPLSLPRRWMREIVHFGSKAPIVGGSSTLNVSEVVAARRKKQPLIGWNAIMLRALALAAERFPELKRNYVPAPWGHLYQHPHCVAAAVVEREWRGENAVFAAMVEEPERKSLRELDRFYDVIKGAKIEAIGDFRRMIRIGRLPQPLRRWVMRIPFQLSGRARSHYMGTFVVNAIPGRRRSLTTQTVSPATVTLFFGSVEPDGSMPVQMFFDHRVMDGNTCARLTNHLAMILKNEIVAEIDAA